MTTNSNSHGACCAECKEVGFWMTCEGVHPHPHVQQWLDTPRGNLVAALATMFLHVPNASALHLRTSQDIAAKEFFSWLSTQEVHETLAEQIREYVARYQDLGDEKEDCTLSADLALVLS